MKPLIFLCLLLALSVPCAAQDASGPFGPIIPAGTWPFAAADTLQKMGVTFGNPDATIPGRRVVTRDVFAEAVIQLLAQMPEKDASNPQTSIGKSLKQSPLAVNALLALVKEFSPEIDRRHRINQDVQKPDKDLLTNAQNFVEGLREQQRRDISEGKIVLTPGELQSAFADLPIRDPAWYAADILQKEGIIFGSLDDLDGAYTGGRIPMTRLQTAKAIARLLSQLPHSLDLSNRLLQTSREIPALRTLVTEFSPELKLLGNNFDSDLAQLTELEKSGPISPAPKQFTDVPPSHWAAASVESLRLHGIVSGYRDGNFSVSP